jgi:preprotein translocase subunit SecG
MASQSPAKLKTPAMKTGIAAAAIVAAGIGSLMMGVLTTAADISAPLSASLNWYSAVGPLMGKTTVMVILWLISWVVLHNMWKNKDVDLQKSFVTSIALIVGGFLLTFPPVFDLIKKAFGG